MRFPDFLIIGAMKAGTTGVFMDMGRHPRVFLPDNKEPYSLCYDPVLTPAGRAEYAAWFAAARPDQLLCDASTGYTKQPDLTGSHHRALELLPAGFKVIYVVRHPIERIVSHHYHEYIEGKLTASIDDDVRRFPHLVNYSRYGLQARPWIESLGRDRVRVLRFEDYTANRQQVVADLCEFVGLDSRDLPAVDTIIHNPNDGKPVMNWFWQRVQASWPYQSVVRPLVSLQLRVLLQRYLLPKAKPRPAPPSAATREWLAEQLAPEVRALQELTGNPALDWGDLSQPPVRKRAADRT